MKITDLAFNAAPDGTETVPHVKGSLSMQASLSALAAPMVNAAQAAANAAEGLIGPTYASVPAGLAGVVSGKPFAVTNTDNTVAIYLNNAGTASLQRVIATTTALAGANGAAFLGFQHKGAGATLRTVQNRMFDSVHLCDYLTAAQVADVVSGTGSIDISTQFQAMIDYWHAQGGATIEFNLGTALLAKPIRLYDNTTLVGGGGGVYGFTNAKGASVFKQAAGAVGNVVNAAIVTAAGTGYTNATIAFTDSATGLPTGATGNVWLSGGAVVGITISDCGLPTANGITGTISGNGTGATVSVQLCVPMFYQSSGGAIINVHNVTLIGNNSPTSSGFVLSNCGPFFYNLRTYLFGLSAWKRMGGAGGHIIGGHIFGCGRGGMAPGTVSYHAGAIDESGTDLQITCIEVGAGPSGDSTNLWNSAIRLGSLSSAGQLSNIVAEGSDVGILCSGNTMMFSNVRCDINYGHGLWMHRTNPVLQPPSANKVWGLWCHRNGRYATNTYDNLRIETGDSITGTLVTGFYSSFASSDGWRHRYGIYDGSGEAVIDAYRDDGAGTAKFATIVNYTPGPVQIRTGLTTLLAVSALNVTGQREVRVSNGSTATTVATLTGGFHGDELVLIPTASNITFQCGNYYTLNTMVLAGFRDRLAVAWQPIYLRNNAGTWYEMTPWARQAAITSPAVSYPTLSSPTANESAMKAAYDADIAALKVAVDALRTMAQTIGLTA